MIVSVAQRWRILGLTLVTVGIACANASTSSSPKRLVDQYNDAVANDDSDAAYALLTPSLQAELSREDFNLQWQQQHPAIPTSQAGGPLHQASVTYPSGRTVRWTVVDGTYVATSGLTETVDLSTPKAALRQYVRLLRSQGDTSSSSLQNNTLSEQARLTVADQYESLASMIEVALDSSENLIVSDDVKSAVLKLSSGTTIRLIKSNARWQIDEVSNVP